tara:strand:- start:16337 stop:16636 length:300 start_codon:yes stop_codon:yes gene_type:complete
MEPTAKVGEYPPNFYYWSLEFKTKEGYSLNQCIEKFGTQVFEHKSDDGVINTGNFRKVIFLDASKSLTNSWLLWKRTCTGMPIRSLGSHDGVFMIEGDI